MMNADEFQENGKIGGAMERLRTAIRYVTYRFIKFRFPQLARAFIVETHLTTEERVKLYELTKTKTIIIEIGSYIGASACCFGAALKGKSAGKLICVDTWNNDAMTEGHRDTWSEFQINTSQYSNHIVPVRGFSTEVAETVGSIAGEADVLFIDGDHSYDSVKADWDAYKPFLRPGSTVIFHDYGWADGVRRVVSEDVMPLVSDQESLPNMWWGRIKGAP